MKRLAGVALIVLLAAALPATAAAPRILAAKDWWPVPSPDGTRVAFTKVYANRMELDVLVLASGRVNRIATSTSQLLPTWSSDSAQLAYGAGGALWTARRDGAAKARVAAPVAAYAPAWRPGGGDLAYLAPGPRGTELWDGSSRLAAGAIGRPAWEPDGSLLAFARSDGIWVTTTPGTPRRLALTVSEPGSPVWSPDGSTLAYVVGSLAYTVPANGSAPPTAVANALPSPGTPAWSADGRTLLIPTARAVQLVDLPSGAVSAVPGLTGPGAAWIGTDVVATDAVPTCPGHAGLGRVSSGRLQPLVGGCAIDGTNGPDVIEGTPLWGDTIVARGGNDQIHVNDGHTDTVFCGPGRDTVWADRSDRLSACEVVHR